MMAEYIEREAAIDLIERLRERCGYDEMVFALNWAAQTVKDIPAADVKPVVRGEWKPSALITSGTGSVWRTHGVVCSVCNGFYLEETNYCPNCGADMRGENDD